MSQTMNQTKEMMPAPQANPNAPPANIVAQQQLSPGAAAFAKTIEKRQEAPPRLPVIKIDHKSGQFVLHTGEVVKEIAGYPVLYFQTRSFYEKAPRPGEKGHRPDCYSLDLMVPHPAAEKKQSPDCLSCKNAQFGTARDGRAQACGVHTWIFMLNSQFGSVPLAVLKVGPSNLRTLLGNLYEAGYFQQAQARHGYYELVWTKFRLRIMGEGASVQYAVLEPIMGPAQEDPQKCRQIAEVANRFRTLMDEFRQGAATPGDDDEDE